MRIFGCPDHEGSRIKHLLTEQFGDWKSSHLGGPTRDPNYIPELDFFDHEVL